MWVMTSKIHLDVSPEKREGPLVVRKWKFHWVIYIFIMVLMCLRNIIQAWKLRPKWTQTTSSHFSLSVQAVIPVLCGHSCVTCHWSPLYCLNQCLSGSWSELSCISLQKSQEAPRSWFPPHPLTSPLPTVFFTLLFLPIFKQPVLHVSFLQRAHKTSSSRGNSIPVNHQRDPAEH